MVSVSTTRTRLSAGIDARRAARAHRRAPARNSFSGHRCLYDDTCPAALERTAFKGVSLRHSPCIRCRRVPAVSVMMTRQTLTYLLAHPDSSSSSFITMSNNTRWEAVHDGTKMLCFDYATYNSEAAGRLWSTRRRDYVHNPTFYPGDIAYASGGITGAYWEFLERLGVYLNKEERELRESVNKSEGIGKYCVVLERVDVDTYWVCYLSRFAGDARTGRISFPAGLFFGLAFGDAQEFPIGFSPLRTSPPWGEPCYLFAAPVLRQGLKVSNRIGSMGSNKNRTRRTSLQAGELERVKSEVQAKTEARTTCHHLFTTS
jgi:hypothetical protein